MTYPDVYRELCEVFRTMRKAGARTPQIAFMVNTQAGATAGQIYRDLYQPGLYRDLWFLWRGKPLMICDPKEASPELRAFFTLRRAHWPFTQVNTRVRLALGGDLPAGLRLHRRSRRGPSRSTSRLRKTCASATAR